MDKSQPQSSLIVEDLPVLNSDRNAEDDSPENVPTTMRSQFGTDTWTDSITPRSKKTKRTKVILTYVGVGIISFLIFLYLSFPFNVVKEVIISKVNETFIQQKLPIRISVASFKPKFPIGINLEDIQVSNVNDPLANIKIGKASAWVNVLSLLIGKVDADVRLTQSGGSLDMNYNVGLAALPKMARQSSSGLPAGNARLTFQNFEIKPLVANALAFVRSGNNPALQTIQPFLRTEVSGQISGNIRLDLPSFSETLDKMLLDVDLKIGKAYFEMKDETLAIPRQEFTDARAKLKLSKKSIEIPTETKFIANDIGINLSGRMNVSDNLGVNDVQLKLGLLLKGKIEENFKTLLPVILGCDLTKMVNGKMDVELNGNFSALTCK